MRITKEKDNRGTLVKFYKDVNGKKLMFADYAEGYLSEAEIKAQAEIAFDRAKSRA